MPYSHQITGRAARRRFSEALHRSPSPPEEKSEVMYATDTFLDLLMMRRFVMPNTKTTGAKAATAASKTLQ